MEEMMRMKKPVKMIFRVERCKLGLKQGMQLFRVEKVDRRAEMCERWE
jgi:hypothetical protein